MGQDRDVTEAELAILQILWEEGPVTVRRLTDRLYAGGGPSAHTTVHKLLDRLEAKNCVRRDRGGPAQVIVARISREDLIAQRAQSLADALCSGSLASLLSHLGSTLEGSGPRTAKSCVNSSTDWTRRPNRTRITIRVRDEVLARAAGDGLSSERRVRQRRGGLAAGGAGAAGGPAGAAAGPGASALDAAPDQARHAAVGTGSIPLARNRAAGESSPAAGMAAGLADTWTAGRCRDRCRGWNGR